MPRGYYGQPSQRPRLPNPAGSPSGRAAGPNMGDLQSLMSGTMGRTPLLQDPINNADPEMLAMLETIMSATMGANGGRGRNPYSQPGFSQGPSPLPSEGMDPPRPAGKYGGWAGDSIRRSWGDLQDAGRNLQTRVFGTRGTGGSGGIAGMLPTQGNMFPEGANMKIQGESDFAVQNVRDRVWSFEDLRMAAESPIFASQNLGISQQAAQAALSRLMAQQGAGMGTGVGTSVSRGYGR